MNFQATFKQMDRSLVLEEYTRRKLGDKIHKYVPKLPIETSVTFSRENHLSKVQCTLRATGGFNVEVENKDEFMYSAVDQLVEKLNTRLRRRKDKNLSKNKQKRITKHFQDETAPPDINPLEEIDAEDILKYEEVKKH